MELSISRQCELLSISRSGYYYQPAPAINAEEIKLLKAIREELLLHPFYGYRKIAIALKDLNVTRKQVRLIMAKAGLRAIYPGKRLSIACRQHEKYPYLLKDMKIWLPNQVWATDITYIRLSGGHVYLVAIIDLWSRKVISWRMSNTMDTEFCVSALREAIELYGVPAVFNTDQGSQFTSEPFIAVLKQYGIRISMDSKGRALDNVYVERLWRTLKYEEIYLHDYRSMDELKAAVKKYFNFYNTERFHQSLEYATPDEIYYSAFEYALKENVA
jgi:putative transposase